MDEVTANLNKVWKAVLYSDKEFDGHSSYELLNTVHEQILKKEKGDISNTCPVPGLWLEFARITIYEQIRVVIIGQDPYNIPGTDHGLAFSSLGHKIPPSLRNIYKCLMNTGHIKKIPKSYDLTKWAEQGVLLINGALSTRQYKPKVHAKKWEPYVDNIVERIASDFEDRGVKLIFMLWGEFAKEYAELVNGNFHEVMTWIHPSPMAQDGRPKSEKFISCDHFTRANEILEVPIDWHIGDTEPISDSESDEEKAPIVSPVVRKYKDGYKPKWFHSNGNSHVVFTDGSCTGNGKGQKAIGGYAAVFVDGMFVDTLLTGNLKTKRYPASNIRAEGMAIKDSLALMLEDPNLEHGCIVTDCEFWVKAIYEYMPSWSDERFRTKANYDITSGIWEMWNQAKRTARMEILHVYSHNKSGWLDEPTGTYKRYCADQNDYLDQLAGYARASMLKGSRKRSKVPYD